MKTTNNDQKSGNMKPNSKFLSAVVALAFISFPVVAQDFISSVSDNGHATILACETRISHSGESVDCQTETKTEFSLQVEGLMNITDYKPAQFTEREMALEIEMWINGSTDEEVINLSLQLTSLMKFNEYRAAEFVEAEIALETEKWMTSVKF